MSSFLVTMFKTSKNHTIYQHKLLHRELLTKIKKLPSTSSHLPDPRRVSFYGDDEYLEKPHWSSVATYDKKSYADSDPFIGIVSIKSYAQVEAEELQAWTDLKAKTSSKVWQTHSPGTRITKEQDEQKALDELCDIPLDISNLHLI